MHINYILDKKLEDCVEYSIKSKCFKLKMNPSEVPYEVVVALRNCTKSTSTVFGGKYGIRVRMLPSSSLSTNLVSQLKSLTATVKFDDACQKMLNARRAEQAVYGRKFYQQVER